MDDVYAMELLRKSLIDACEREHGLTIKLQAGQEEMESLKRIAIANRIKFQELDEALEIEGAKTNAERLARQEADETTRQHRAEAARAKRKETIANEHCDAAEAEVLRLQRDLSTESSAVIAAEQVLCQLREDLGQAKINEKVANEQLNAAKAKACSLQDDLGVATNRICMLECQMRQLEDQLKREHQRMERAENALCTLACELERTELTLSDTLEKYNDLEATHNKCKFARSVAATAFNTDRLEVDKQTSVCPENEDSASSEQTREQCLEIDRDLSTAKNQTKIGTEIPTFPKPAILRPALTSVTGCHIEIFKATGRIVPAPRANPKNHLWKYFWGLPSNSLHLLFRVSGRR